MNKGFRFGSRTREVNREVMEEREIKLSASVRWDAIGTIGRYAPGNVSQYGGVIFSVFGTKFHSGIYACRPGMKKVKISDATSSIRGLACSNDELFYADNTGIKSFLDEELITNQYFESLSYCNGDLLASLGRKIYAVEIDKIVTERNVDDLVYGVVGFNGSIFDYGNYGVCKTLKGDKIHDSIFTCIVPYAGNLVGATVDNKVTKSGHIIDLNKTIPTFAGSGICKMSKLPSTMFVYNKKLFYCFDNSVYDVNAIIYEDSKETALDFSRRISSAITVNDKLFKQILETTKMDGKM